MRTIQHAAEALKPGDTVLIGPGGYRERIELRSGVSHVRLRGLTFRYSANHAQRGAFVMGAEARDWVIEDCRFERANGPGATFTGSGHAIRRCDFQDNGQLGFGAWSCHETRMELCGIFRNNTKGYSTAWEAGGLKITLSRGFAMIRCRAEDNRGPGIWYDIGNEKSEVAHCFIAGNDDYTFGTPERSIKDGKVLFSVEISGPDVAPPASTLHYTLVAATGAVSGVLTGF